MTSELFTKRHGVNDQVGLSAMTLVIIHIRAEIAGPKADPARAAINAFTATWLRGWHQA